MLSKLGAGGMGEVWLAEDPRLRRRVAIKRVRGDVLDHALRTRLMTEARAAARLDHPNICAIFEVGEDEAGPFIVMPVVEGETLAARLARGPLPLDQAVTIAAQVADALAAAHARGIFHRDIKPANIMIGPRGHARVMDFGLAKFLVSDTLPSETESTAARTDSGVTMGTAPYMSPEQARGEAVDHRSDLFSLGVVIYEMVAGQRPFTGATFADTVSALLTYQPPLLANFRPGVSDDLQRIVTKLLQKNRDERYQTAGDAVVDLQHVPRPGAPETAAPPAARVEGRGWAPIAVAAFAVTLVLSGVAFRRGWSANPTPPAAIDAPRIESLAVLPLANNSADTDQDYFAAGMTEALIAELARIKGLRVISRTSTAQYKNTTKRLPEIARELQVDGIVEGSVTRDGDEVRITAQLIHGPTDRHLWANSYDGTLREVLALQRRVAEAITSEVRVTVTPEERSAMKPARAIDPAAQDLFLKSRELLSAGINSDALQRIRLLDETIASCEAALRIQPDWAEPWACIAKARHWQVLPQTDPAKLFPAARAAALKAIALDDTLADGHGALGYVLAAYDWDWAGAEREFRRARELNRTTPYTHGYAMTLSALGRHDEAKVMFEEAMLRDPFGLVLHVNAARERLRARDYENAIRLAKGKSVLVEASALVEMGHPDQGLAILNRVADPRDLGGAAVMARAMVKLGREEEARRRGTALLRGATDVKDAGEIAEILAALGDHAQALDWLERARVARLPWLPAQTANPAFDAVRGDPRFLAILRSMGLPASRDFPAIRSR